VVTIIGQVLFMAKWYHLPPGLVGYSQKGYKRIK